MKTIILIGIIALFLVSIVSAGNPVQSFWESKGLNPESSARIGLGKATLEDNLLASELQNKSRGIDPESELNITQIEEERKAEAKEKADAQGFIFGAILVIMMLISIIVVGLIIIKEKA